MVTLFISVLRCKIFADKNLYRYNFIMISAEHFLRSRYSKSNREFHDRKKQLTHTRLNRENFFSIKVPATTFSRSSRSKKSTMRAQLKHSASTSNRLLSVSTPAAGAYKDVAEVVKVVAQAGLGRIVARLRPMAVIKG